VGDRSVVFDSPSVSPVTCGGCGRALPAGASFCGSCGRRLTVPPPAPVASPPVLPRMGLATGVIAAVAVAALAFPVGRWLFVRREAAASPSTTASAAPAPAGTKGPVTCTNKQAKFTIKVPRTWVDTFDGGPCLRFNVPLGHDPYIATLQVTPDAGAFDQLHVTGTVQQTKEGNVSNRPATVYETTYSDKGVQTHAYGYLLQVGDRAFSIRLLNFPYTPVPNGVRSTFDEVVRELRIQS